MIYAKGKTNIALTGMGVIDGQGDGIWNDWKALEGKDKQQSRRMNHRQTPINERVFGMCSFLRPQLIQFFDCSNILVQGVRIENSPFWCLHMLRSSNITIRGISFDAQNRNNDGIDLEYANNVLIENVVFNNSDDNIAIKAGRDVDGRSNAHTPSQNIVVRNCKFKGLHAIVIGSEMSAGVKNVFVEDSQAYGFLKRGIYIKTNSDRGGYIKNIYFNNLSFQNVLDAIYITANYHGEGSGQHASKISDIYFDSISFNEAEDYGIALEGYQSEKVKDIYLSNISIKKAKNPISLLNTKNIILEEVVIGNLAGVPSSIE
jgi:polygalacturonase